MDITDVIMYVLVNCVLEAYGFSFQQLSQQLDLLSGHRSTTNCTFREINSNSKCVSFADIGAASNSNRLESDALFLSSASSTSSSASSWSSYGQDHSQLSYFHVWAYSIGSAFFISLSGLWGYLLLPLLTGAYQNHVMNVLVGLSCGSLVTSSLCQLIPESYELWLLSPDYMYVAIFSMLGVWIILFAQGVASIFRKSTIKEEMKLEITNKSAVSNSDIIRQKTRNGGPAMSTKDVDAAHPLFGSSPNDMLKSKMNVGAIAVDSETRVHSATLLHRRRSYQSGVQEKAKLTKLAIIILAGDFMNNFMDGISIGAGYAYHLSTGLKLTTAISFEEYTHKLGDFAIVFQSGISMSRVLFWNYSTSCACFLGVVIGIALGNLNWSKYIFSFASGLFLYIALSNMIPEMQNMLDTSLNQSKKLAIISLVEQHIGFILAFVALMIISLLLNTSSAPVKNATHV